MIKKIGGIYKLDMEKLFDVLESKILIMIFYRIKEKINLIEIYYILKCLGRGYLARIREDRL